MKTPLDICINETTNLFSKREGQKTDLMTGKDKGKLVLKEILWSGVHVEWIQWIQDTDQRWIWQKKKNRTHERPEILRLSKKFLASPANLQYMNLGNMLIQCALSCNICSECDSCSDLLPVRDIYAVCAGQPHILEVSGGDCGRHSSSHNINVELGKRWQDSIYHNASRITISLHTRTSFTQGNVNVFNISLICDNSVTTQVSQHNSVTKQQRHNTTVSQHNSVTTASQHNSVTTQ